MPSPLARAAGPVALAAGLPFAAIDVTRYLVADPALPRQVALTDPAARVVLALYFAAFCGLLIALAAVHLRTAEQAGGLGAFGFCAALVGTVAMAGNMWFEGFAVPWLADVAPSAILAGGSGTLVVGGLSSYLLFAFGWAAFGLAGWRSHTFPAVLGAAFVVAGLLGYGAGLPPYGIPVGLAMAGLGWWITRNPVTAAAGREVAC